MLKEQQVQEILARVARGEPVLGIARALGIDPKTVRAWRARGGWRARRCRPRASVLDAHAAWLRARAPEVDYNCAVLWRELRGLGYPGSVAQVHRFVRPLRVAARQARQATVRFETPPGQQAPLRRRRDDAGYTIALVHQHQRERQTVERDGTSLSYIDLTPADIALANRLAAQALGHTLDELPPQTRRFLTLLDRGVAGQCQHPAASGARSASSRATSGRRSASVRLRPSSPRCARGSGCSATWRVTSGSVPASAPSGGGSSRRSGHAARLAGRDRGARRMAGDAALIGGRSGAIFLPMMHHSDALESFEAGYERTAFRDLPFADALARFSALWREARTLNPALGADWAADLDADLAIARAVNGLPPTA